MVLFFLSKNRGWVFLVFPFCQSNLDNIDLQTPEVLKAQQIMNEEIYFSLSLYV